MKMAYSLCALCWLMVGVSVSSNASFAADEKKPAAKPDAAKPDQNKADPKKAESKPTTKAAAKSSADVVGIIGEVKEVAGGPSGLMVQHGSRGRNGRQPAKYEEFQIEPETKIEFTGFPKDSKPVLAIDQHVEITLLKDSKTVIAKVVVHPKSAKLDEKSKESDKQIGRAHV